MRDFKWKTLSNTEFETRWVSQYDDNDLQITRHVEPNGGPTKYIASVNGVEQSGFVCFTDANTCIRAHLSHDEEFHRLRLEAEVEQLTLSMQASF